MSESEQSFLEFFTCSWCKKQIKKSDQSNHIDTCESIPASEKERLKKELGL